jgi:hypothetical protein
VRGVARPPPLSTITYKVVVYAPAERADSLRTFLLYLYMYSVMTPIVNFREAASFGQVLGKHILHSNVKY